MAARAGRDGAVGVNGAPGRDGRDSRVPPDPTVPTQVLVDKAVESLQGIMDARIDGQKEVFSTRLAGMDEAIRLLQTIMDRLPTQVDATVGHLKSLHEERFKTVIEQFSGVQTQFAERDVRVRDAALANTTAINAALQSQKEAAGEQAKSFTLSIDKSEKGTLEQIAQQRVLLETMKQGMDGKVDDLKERLTRIESLAAGALAATVETRSAAGDNRGGNQFALQMVMGLVTVIAVAFSIVMALRG